MKIKYAVADKTTGKIISIKYANKEDAKAERDRYQFDTKRGMPQAPTEEDPTDHRSNQSNWTYVIRKV